MTCHPTVLLGRSTHYSQQWVVYFKEGCCEKAVEWSLPTCSDCFGPVWWSREPPCASTTADEQQMWGVGYLPSPFTCGRHKLGDSWLLERVSTCTNIGVSRFDVFSSLVIRLVTCRWHPLLAQVAARWHFWDIHLVIWTADHSVECVSVNVCVSVSVVITPLLTCRAVWCQLLWINRKPSGVPLWFINPTKSWHPHRHVCTVYPVDNSLPSCLNEDVHSAVIGSLTHRLTTLTTTTNNSNASWESLSNSS